MRTKEEIATLRQANLLRAEAQLQRWSLRLDELTRELERQGPSSEPLVQGEYRRRLDGLRAKHAAVSSRFLAFKEPGVERWATFQAAVVSDWNELAHGMKELGRSARQP